MVATNFNVSSRQGFKLWGLSPWVQSLADPCLTLAWASQLSMIIYTNLHSLPQESCRQESSCVWCWPRPGWSAASRLATYRVGGGRAGLHPACCRPALQKRFGSSANCSGITDGQILFEVYIDLQKCFIIVWRVVSDVADNSNHNNNIGL